jgi:hypothetical protein
MVQSFRTAERVLIDAFCIFCIRSSFNSAEQRSRILAIGAVLDKVEMATLDAYLETQRQLQQDHNNSTAVLVTRLPTGSRSTRRPAWWAPTRHCPTGAWRCPWSPTRNVTTRATWPLTGTPPIPLPA